MTPKRAASGQEPSRPPNLTISRLSAAKQLASQVEKGQELLKYNIQSDKDFEDLQTKYYRWEDYNTELLQRIFDNDQIYQKFRLYSFGSSGGPLSVKIQGLFNDIKYYIRGLESVRERLPLIPEPENLKHYSSDTSAKDAETIKEVFVVHGTDQGTKEATARYLEQLGLIPIILHEKPNLGDTIIEKLERNSSVGYAIVLLTDDDKGFPKNDSSEIKPRARQNVVFELGYFIGKLGRKKVCALYSEGVELHSDFSGVVYIPLDKSGAWKFLLAKELKASGLAVDLNKA